MSRLDFVKKLYNGKNCYSDHMSEEDLDLIHVKSKVEEIISDMLEKNKIIFITGNPGDGKTFIIKAIEDTIEKYNAYVEKDLNDVIGYNCIIENIIDCYNNNRPAIIAVNEYPFMMLLKEIRKNSTEIYKEIIDVKKSVITYAESSQLTGRIALIDLNERNLLDKNSNLLEFLMDKFVMLLSDDAKYNKVLEYNIKALSIKEIKGQLLYLMNLAASGCDHFAIRDILGAFSFIFTACVMEDYYDDKYYTAIFNGKNQLLQAMQKFDPIYLSSPQVDEKLWNGDISEGWIMKAPEEWPNSRKFDDDIQGALECFKEIKRKYYFENIKGQELKELQPEEIKKCTDLFLNFESKKKKIKENLIKNINKLFLPSIEDKKQLHIWTTHRYDMSMPSAVAVSSKSIESSDLEILMPRPADWINKLEYIPDHIVLKPKACDDPKLKMDIDFLRTLSAIEDGYPVNLLAPQYEQAAAMFLQQLDDNNLTEENDDGEIIIASRKNCYQKIISIQDCKYGFEED